MIRLFTYLSLDGSGYPTAAGTYFDPLLSELSGAQLAQNMNVQVTRKGYPIILYDSAPQYPIAAQLTIAVNHVDEPSKTSYGGICFLGPVLYDHAVNHLPLCIFAENINENSRKCYVVYFAPGGFDTVLSAVATPSIHAQMFLERASRPNNFTFDLVIAADGTYIDKDHIDSASWNTRVP